MSMHIQCVQRIFQTLHTIENVGVAGTEESNKESVSSKTRSGVGVPDEMYVVKGVQTVSWLRC